MAHQHLPNDQAGDKRVWWAIAVNLALTLVQIAGGILSGSLSLVADAIHNLSDAISMAIAYIARRIARRPANEEWTFGYVRAELIAALINYTTLIVIGLYLIYEAVFRFIEPQPVQGWAVVIIAAFALVVDTITAMLTYSLSKSSINIRAAFLHNVSDALGSIAVIIAGTLIILYDWVIVDPLITLMIAGYILWQAFKEIGGAIRILMSATPKDINPQEIISRSLAIPGVCGMHHLHIWPIDEHRTSLEAHIVIEGTLTNRSEAIKNDVKNMLNNEFSINHTTLEVESRSRECGDAKTYGH
ncbi:MAG: cation diffusion facilitator family transporter [Pseudomonas sp.]|uniref:Cation transporter n=2 Tax=Halopseudomonas TaxID=2901189 RepID=A0A4U0YI10_9GAMM|nr:MULTISPECIES: cation diffusion facilitator family transporter [Halopseudomonas]TKA91632.1 cation transporter [Halopseudomonas bauzanensis]SDT03646.1 cobalt-zinc-cadmium efflux system protein [Halopseudomonas litoralis]